MPIVEHKQNSPWSGGYSCDGYKDEPPISGFMPGDMLDLGIIMARRLTKAHPNYFAFVKADKEAKED